MSIDSGQPHEAKPKRKSEVKRKSVMWGHFNLSKTDPKYAECTHCGASIHITNLWKHYRRHHERAEREEEKVDKEEEEEVEEQEKSEFDPSNVRFRIRPEKEEEKLQRHKLKHVTLKRSTCGPRRHLKGDHKEDGKLACKFCRFRASKKRILDWHVEKAHPTEKGQRASDKLGVELRLKPVAVGELVKLRKKKSTSTEDCAGPIESSIGDGSEEVSVSNVDALRCSKCDFVTFDKEGNARARLSQHILTKHVKFAEATPGHDGLEDPEILDAPGMPAAEIEGALDCSETENSSCKKSEVAGTTGRTAEDASTPDTVARILDDNKMISDERSRDRPPTYSRLRRPRKGPRRNDRRPAGPPPRRTVDDLVDGLPETVAHSKQKTPQPQLCRVVQLQPTGGEVIEISSSDEEVDEVSLKSAHVRHHIDGEGNENKRKPRTLILETVKPVMDFSRSDQCNFVTTESTKLSQHISSKHDKSTTANKEPGPVRLSDLARIEREHDTISSQYEVPTCHKDGTREGGRGRKRNHQRVLVALRPTSEFLRCKSCTYVTTERAKMSAHDLEHSEGSREALAVNTEVEFIVVDDIQEEVEIATTDANGRTLIMK